MDRHSQTVREFLADRLRNNYWQLTKSTPRYFKSASGLIIRPRLIEGCPLSGCPLTLFRQDKLESTIAKNLSNLRDVEVHMYVNRSACHQSPMIVTCTMADLPESWLITISQNLFPQLSHSDHGPPLPVTVVH